MLLSLVVLVTNAKDITIYVQAEAAPYLYVWGGADNGSWPGTQMTETEEVQGTTFWKKTFEATGDLNIIFNDGAGNQTSDIKGLQSDHYFTYDGAIGYEDVTSKYITVPDAEITKVQLLGEWNWDTAKEPLTLTPIDGGDNTFGGVLDLTDVTADQEFKLVVNGSVWIGYGSSMVIDAPEGWVDGQTEGSWNYILKNADTNYKTYTITAAWNANPNATDGWTLKIEGKDLRNETIYIYAVVGGKKVAEDEEADAAIFSGYWDAAGTNDLMALEEESGKYVWKKEAAKLEPQTIELKVIKKVEGAEEAVAWYPTDNVEIEIAEAGEYNVTVTFDPNAEDLWAQSSVTAYAEKISEEPTELQPVTIPDGLVVEDYTLRAWHYVWYTPEDGSDGKWSKYSREEYQDLDEVLRVKVGFDGKDVYIQGFFDWLLPDAWVKGTLSDDETTVTFRTQYYGTYETDYNLYLYGYDFSSGANPTDMVFLYDKEHSTFRLPSSMAVLNNFDSEQQAIGEYYRWVVISKGYQEEESLVEPPADLHVEDYSFSASVITYDADGNTVETPSTFGVKVGFNGNDVYIKGLCQLLPDAWVKGTLKDGKLTIAANQYLGYAESYEVFLTAMPANYTDWMGFEDIVLNYDSEAKVFTGEAEQLLIVNASKVRIYYNTLYVNTTISRLLEQSVAPETPQLVNVANYDDNNGYGYLRFNIPLTDIYGNGLLEDKLYYQVLIDNEHVISEYVFSKDKYETLSEDLSLIPYTFTDSKYFDLRFNYDTRVTDKIVFIMENEPFSKNRIGLRSVYYGGGIENVSETVWYSLREFADVLALQAALERLSSEIDSATELLNDETKARGKDDLQAVIAAAAQILQNTTSPDDIDVVNQTIANLVAAEEAYIALNLMIEPAEWMALRTYYQSVGEGEGWEKKWDFSSNVPSVATLPGVTAYDGHVVSIDLSGNGVSGMFPIALLALPQLESLNLSGNQLTGDLGLTVAAYVKMNPTAQIVLRHVDISNNQLTGNVGLFAACLPNLETLDASHNCLEDVYPMISPNVTSLNLGQQTIGRVVELNLDNLTVEAMAEKMPSILLYNHAQQTFIPEINILCTNGELADYRTNWSIILSYKNGQATIPYASSANVYYGQSGDVLNVAVVNDTGMFEGTTFRIQLGFNEGDANFDGKVSVLDVQADVKFIFNEYDMLPFNFTAANLWNDEQINVQDIVPLVNLLFETNTPATQMIRRSASTDDADAVVFCANGNLMVSTTRPVAAFDITLSGCRDINVKALRQQGFVCESRQTLDGLRLIGYSLSGSTLPVGESVIGQMDSANGSATCAQLADTDALEIMTEVGDNGHLTNINTPGATLRDAGEAYRLSLGNGHAISIDSHGKKTFINDTKKVK